MNGIGGQDMAGEGYAAQPEPAGDNLDDSVRAPDDYISAVVSDPANDLHNAFAAEIPPEGEGAEALFARTERLLRMLELRALSPFATWHYPRLRHDGYEILCRLGWATLAPVEGQHPGLPPEYRAYTLHPTQRGLGLVEGLRASKGELPLEAARQENRVAMLRQLATAGALEE